MLNTTLGSLYSALFPSECRLCQSPLVTISRLPVCESCVHCIEPLPAGLCRACGDLLPIGFQSGDGLCPECAFEAPGFERAVAYGAYTSGLRELIHLLKYEQIRPAANVLGRMLAEAAASLELTGEVTVIPVPLHASKLKTRGFNQSELIAHASLPLLRGASYSLEAVAMRRRRETPSQVGMSREQRRQNLRGAFAVTVPAMVRDKQVLLVDDVLTTGATVSECTRVLKRAGAQRVWVATVARAVRVTDTFALAEHEHTVPLAMVTHG
jgi:ComF family protein